MKRFRESVKEFFTYVRNERQGVFWLLALNVLLIIVWISKDAYIAAQTSELYIEYIEKETVDEEGSTVHSSTKKEPELFYFDPNGLSKEDWRKLGLSDKQIRGIHNYEEAGGNFKRKEDVLKMYTVSEELYFELEPYIRIENLHVKEPDEFKELVEPKWKEKEYGSTKEEVVLPIELNSADTAQLESLRGIGPVYAKNMLKYRALLGGYHSKSQLNEVYGLRENPELVKSISENLTIDTLSIKKMDLNAVTAEELADHIYIKWKVANAIVAYRNAHGPYKKVPALLECALVDEALLTKIAPYLMVD